MKILFASYGGGHIKAILPLVEKLRNDSNYDCRMLALTTAGKECAARQIPYKTLRDFLHLYPQQAHSFGEKLAAGLVNSTLDPEESAAYLGISFHDLAEELGDEKAFETYNQSGRGAFSPVGAMETLLREVKPDLLVTTNSPRTEKALQIAARNLGIASLCLVDFYPGAELDWLSTPGYGTKICVLDAYVKDQLIKRGRSADDVVITGNPAFDHYGSPEAVDTAANYRSAYLKDAKRLIAYASNLEPGSDTPPLQERMLTFLQRECAALGYALSLRRHPSETMRQLPPGVLDGNAVTLETFMSSADGMVTFPSTIAYEARLLATPVAVLGMSKLASDAGFWHTGEYQVAADEGALIQWLKILPVRTPAKAFTQSPAADRVIDTIRKIACNP